MIRLAILYSSALIIPAVVLIWRSVGASGNHWPLVGTPLDTLLTTLGALAAIIAALPLLALAGLAAWHRYRRGVLICGGLALVTWVVIQALVLVAAN